MGEHLILFTMLTYLWRIRLVMPFAMLGEDLLVAPVFTGTGEVDVYLPAGRWVHLLDGEEVDTGDGGRFLRRRYDVHSLGLFARAGSAPLRLVRGES